VLIDLLIIAMAAAGIYRGRGSGFLRQFLSAAGFFGGLFLGRWLAPHLVSLGQTIEDKTILTILTIIGVGLVGLSLGEYAALHFKHRLLQKRLNKLDNGLGSVLGVVAAVLSVWLLASLVVSLPANALKSQVQQSKIVAELNRLLPPAPQVLTDLARLIDPNGFPDVFIGNEPIPRGNINLPSLGDFAAAVNADKDSVVRLRGQGCGGIVSGSGFVVRSNMVVTNAHVVAGIATPFVQDVNGTHRGTVIWFDPDLDLAVLRVNGLAGKPLTIAGSAAGDGTPAAVLGYPGGGNFSAGPAAVIDQILARGRDIYGRGLTIRSIYEVQADVVPGNSGGPLIAQDGTVLGLVFAESTSYQHVAYALTPSKINTEVGQAAGQSQPTGTGQCAD
jgi:S1-C subfamily serine protease